MSIPRSASDSALISLAASTGNMMKPFAATSVAGNMMKQFAATSVASKVKTTPSSGGTNLPFAVTSVAGSCGTIPSSGGTSQSLVVTQVVPPTMGGVTVEGGKTPFETALTGGKPNPAYTQLVNQAVLDSQDQLRSVESKCTTACNLRRAGLDFPDDGVIDNDDAVVDPIRVERERDRDRAKLEDVLSAVAHGHRKNKPKEWVNAVLYKLSLIGVTDTTILQQRLPALSASPKCGYVRFPQSNSGRNIIRSVKNHS